MLASGGFSEGTLVKLEYRHVREDLEKGVVPLHVYVEAAITKGKYHNYDTFLGKEAVDYLEADVWFEPTIVLEILGAEITLSPIPTCAMDSIRKRSGLAIRFPRFTGNYRLDKAAEDATTAEEIVEMYKSQLKKNRRVINLANPLKA